MSSAATTPHRWRFYRLGGFDQVAIETADDLRHLDQLDPKLWTALNCPSRGLEFDARTLALIDGDGDGQIRVPEILTAVRWACGLLKNPQVLFQPEGLPLTAIDDSRPEGAQLRAAGAQVLGYLGRTADDTLKVADFDDMTHLFPTGQRNGDGIVPVGIVEDAGLNEVIAQIIATQGGAVDRSGETGITAETLAAFFEQTHAVLAWRAERGAAVESLAMLGEGTDAAAEALAAVQAKVDDYFARCHLAAFDPRAAQALNPPETAYEALAVRTIAALDAEVQALPLAAVQAGQPLPLVQGLNPAWAARVDALRRLVVQPLLGPRDSLTADEWVDLSARFAAWREWLARRPETAVHELALEHLANIAADDTQQRLTELIEQDTAADASATTVDALERLVRYQRDLVTLLRNFVSLADFYDLRRWAIFQAGTLYLDQRSCDLVLRVADMAAHTKMAPFSGCFLVYCKCESGGREPITIVAALTGGDVDELLVAGRHGVFYDRDGRDWKATVVQVVVQPVSIRQAFWTPYRRVAAFIETQIRNFAASREKDVEGKAQAGVTGVAAQAGAGAPPAPAFDIAKFAGIFAAMGLAVGALGTALAAMLSGLFALVWWQMPLVLLGLVLLISGPSMLLAWLTLRRRNVGPLLDANGWAMNARARINLPFGRALTRVAQLPSGARRELGDPFAESNTGRYTALLVVLLALVTVLAWQRGWLQALFGGA